MEIGERRVESLGSMQNEWKAALSSKLAVGGPKGRDPSPRPSQATHLTVKKRKAETSAAAHLFISCVLPESTAIASRSKKWRPSPRLPYVSRRAVCDGRCRSGTRCPMLRERRATRAYRTSTRSVPAATLVTPVH